MDSAKTWLLANVDDAYKKWTDISLVPRAMVRAVTFSTVASIYSRRIYAPKRTRTLLRSGPVTTTPVTNYEAAMEYWETRVNEAFEYYYSTVGLRINVSTRLEDPIFTVADLPQWSQF